MNDIDIFKSAVPDYAKTSQSKAMQAMATGLSGGFGNRISLRGMRFRLIQNGVDVGVVPTPHLDVVIFALAQHVQRIYYIKAYDPETASAPDCFSHDGITPSPESTSKQAEKCNLCPQNVRGSGKMGGNTKACAYKKRVILCPENLEGPSYSLDVNGQSMFGEQIDSQNRFSFRGYFEKLSAHGVAIDAVVTRMTFDDAASVPKLHFTPVRVLTKEEHAAIVQRADDPEVDKMLKDLTNGTEVEAPAVKATPAVAAPVKAEPVAPKATATPAAPKTKGFVVEATAAPAVAVPTNGGGGKTLTIDIDNLTKFDD